MHEITWKYGGPVSEEDVGSVEANLAVVLPSDYRAFVREHNGARPRPNAVEIPGKREVVMEGLLRLDSGARESVNSAALALRKRGDRNLVPFGRDPFGNLFCFQYSGRSVSEVVFWDHENGSASSICKTFSDLVGLLHEPRR